MQAYKSEIDRKSSMAIIMLLTVLLTVAGSGFFQTALGAFQNESSAVYYEQSSPLVPLNETSTPDHINQHQQQDNNFKPENFYSQENLVRLIPSLVVSPQLSLVKMGESVQFVCTSGSFLGPDPATLDGLEWHFELATGDLHSNKPESSPLPDDVLVTGNVLTIQLVQERHQGLYRCRYQMPAFHGLEAEASGRLLLRPHVDSAPQVWVIPEMVRLSPNGSATIQCEASGNPAPSLTWFAGLDGSSQIRLSPKSHSVVNWPSLSEGTSSLSSLDQAENGDETNSHHDDDHDDVDDDHENDQLRGLELDQISAADTRAYCKLNGCSSFQPSAISVLKILNARSIHQGKYLCQASNSLGSNQASSIVDVEYKEAPAVRIQEPREQIIVLPREFPILNNSATNNLAEGIFEQQNQKSLFNVTFRCTVLAGRPLPKLQWVHKATNGNFNKLGSPHPDDQTEISPDGKYDDLTKVSSATSKVATWQEDQGQTLALSIGTISIEDEGDYICKATNEVGRNHSLARLVIRRPISVQIVQTSPLIARPGDSFQLDCLSGGHPLASDIEWSRTDRGSFFSLISRVASASDPGSSQLKATLKFDRVTSEESGEYTCTARNYLEPNNLIRDTIMILVESNETTLSANPSRPVTVQFSDGPILLPRLMMRPAKALVAVGSNVTLDCLAVSGLQPTIVEWLMPQLFQQSIANSGNNLAQLSQFGSRLRITNVQKYHEGVYQCRGRNRLGVENAPALISVAETDSLSGNSVAKSIYATGKQDQESQTKTKVARAGTNIELKCQVTGIEQPETSWSRDGQELPASSVQIEHNLWIQNVSELDNGLYICSARSREFSKLIQAKVNLLVRPDQHTEVQSRLVQWDLSAKIVVSKSVLNLGDSVTLECTIQAKPRGQNQQQLDEQVVQELERNVVWTNSNWGQSLFQPNVYIQENLLIIYDLKPENLATSYRCSFNDLSQHVDYKLQLADNQLASNISQQGTLEDSTSETHNRTTSRVAIRQIAVDSRLKLECPLVSAREPNQVASYHWTRGPEWRSLNAPTGEALQIDSIRSRDADLYHCHVPGPNTTHELAHFIVQVLSPVARFNQQPSSFVTLPTISGADHQLLIELKFLPERDSGLIIFNGQNELSRQAIAAAAATSAANRTKTSLAGDYVSLGLNRGHLELRFELGDGTTLLRSAAPIQLNQWHRVLIERDRRGATMWLDGRPPISNSSTGKFFNLNLDSVLFVGGAPMLSQGQRVSGYSRGFQGCIAHLRIGQQEINLMSKNRTVSVGLYECDKLECSASTCRPETAVCQVDRTRLSTLQKGSPQRSYPEADLRCICLPGLMGPNCAERAPPPPSSKVSGSMAQNGEQAVENNDHLACGLLKPCSVNGTSECISISSTAYRCLCRLGSTGDTCSKSVQFYTNMTKTIGFAPGAYLRFSMSKSLAAQAVTINETNWAENQTISLRVRTRSSYGLLLYMGPAGSIAARAHRTDSDRKSDATIKQSTKSLVANSLVRLLPPPQDGAPQVIQDFLALALVDGHVELSYELGSGVAVIRSSRRVNDGLEHNIWFRRTGRRSVLVIDDWPQLEGQSPGRLSMLNVPSEELYLGGLPQLVHSAKRLANFSGCIGNLDLNGQVQTNLIGPDDDARNVLTCEASLSTGTSIQMPNQSETTTAKVPLPYRSPPEMSDDPDELR